MILKIFLLINIIIKQGITERKQLQIKITPNIVFILLCSQDYYELF